MATVGCPVRRMVAALMAAKSEAAVQTDRHGPEPTRLMRIGELANMLGLTTRTLRHYEDLGVLLPIRRSDSGYRLYDAGSVARLRRVEALKRLGLSLEEIAEVIDFYEDDPSGIAGKREVLKILRRQLSDTDSKIEALQGFRSELKGNISRVEAWIRDAAD